MTGPPSSIIPLEIASHVLKDVDLFLRLQVNDIEPFCQDEIALYKQCVEKRKRRLQDSEHKLGLSMPIDEAKQRATQLQAEAASLAANSCQWNSRHGRILSEMEFARSLYRYQAEIRISKSGNIKYKER